MINRKLLPAVAISLSALLVGCASAPKENAMVTEARTTYSQVENDPNVARSGPAQLRSAKNKLERAEKLLEEGAETDKIEHAAYLANRHAQIAFEQGERARLQQEINSAEKRREELVLQMRTNEAEQARKEAEQARQEAKALQRQMEAMKAMQAEQTDRGMVLTLGDVLFDVGKANLKSSAERTVERLADFMAEYPDRRVRIEGYTDSTGADSFNQQLSEDRAQAVKSALTSRGIASDRVDVKGYGEQFPVASNDTNSGRQQNRRVEIVISDQKGNIETR